MHSWANMEFDMNCQSWIDLHIYRDCLKHLSFKNRSIRLRKNQPVKVCFWWWFELLWTKLTADLISSCFIPSLTDVRCFSKSCCREAYLVTLISILENFNVIALLATAHKENCKSYIRWIHWYEKSIFRAYSQMFFKHSVLTNGSAGLL